jgi:hypothetical protein
MFLWVRQPPALIPTFSKTSADIRLPDILVESRMQKIDSFGFMRACYTLPCSLIALMNREDEEPLVTATCLLFVVAKERRITKTQRFLTLWRGGPIGKQPDDLSPFFSLGRWLLHDA